MAARRYTKADVQTHVQGYYGASLPAVNVKTSPWTVDKHLRQAAEDNGYDADGFVAYIEAQDEDRFWDGVFEFACQSGWEMLESVAKDIFGDVKVWSEGRSGGWAVVDGLPDIEDWDAVQLAKWRKFERYARAIADDIPYQMASLAVINDYEGHLDEIERNERTISKYLLDSLV